MRDLIGESSRFFLSSIAIRLQAQSGVFFVGAILGPASAATYSLTVRAYETVLSLIILINGSLVPSVTHLLGSGNIARFRVVVLRLLVFLPAVTALAMTATIVLNPGFLKLWVGDGAFGGQAVSVLMAVSIFISSIGGIAYDALLAQGKFRVVTRFFVITSFIQVALLASLTHLGMWAAPFATIVTGCIWGVGFWRTIAADVGMTVGESRPQLVELLRLLGISAAGAATFSLLYPPSRTWTALVAEGFICVACMTSAYLAMGANLRRIAMEEIGTTLRLFRAA